MVLRGVEHLEGTLHVGAHELAGAVDRAVDVRLGGEVVDHRGAHPGVEGADVLAVTDVAVHELEPW